MGSLKAALRKYASASLLTNDANEFGVKTNPLTSAESVFPSGGNFGVKAAPLVPQGGLTPPPAAPAQPTPTPTPAATAQPASVTPATSAAPSTPPPSAAAPTATTPPASNPQQQPQPVSTPTTESPNTTITPAPASPPVQQPASPQQPATPAPMNAGAISAKLQTMLPQNSKVPPEQQAEFAKGLEGWMGENADRLRGAQDFVAGKKDTPQAQAFATQLQQKQDEFVSSRMKQLAAADPTAASTPQGWSGMFGQAMQSWEQMPQEMKWVMGLGLGGGLLGMASSIFGEGGAGMGLLGLLGIGTAGLVGASQGMFGQGASKMVGDAAYNIGSFFGAVPEAKPGTFDMLRGKDPLAAMTGGKIGTRKEVAARLADSKTKIEQLRQFMALPLGPDAKMQLIQRIDPSIDSPETAQEILRNAGTVLGAYDDPNSALQRQMQQGQAYSNSSGVKGKLMEMGAGLKDRAPGIISALSGLFKSGNHTMNIQHLIEKWAFNDMDAKELNDLKAERAKGVPYRTEDARREHELNLRQQANAPAVRTKKCVAVVMKAARCWSGYEPVPGAKAYSRGSCRPVNSKKTQKEMISGKNKSGK